MNHQTIPIIYGWILYALYVLLPLVPAVLIYKIFPDTKVGADGLLGNLKINATGAFAAYLIVVVIGFFIIKNNQELINNLQFKGASWVVNSKCTFWEKTATGLNPVDISDESVKSDLKVSIFPNYEDRSSLGVSFVAYSENQMPKITFNYPGYKRVERDMSIDSLRAQASNRNPINLGEIQFIKINQEYDTSARNFTQPVSPAAAGVPVEGPPVTVVTNAKPGQ